VHVGCIRDIVLHRRSICNRCIKLLVVIVIVIRCITRADDLVSSANMCGNRPCRSIRGKKSRVYSITGSARGSIPAVYRTSPMTHLSCGQHTRCAVTTPPDMKWTIETRNWLSHPTQAEGTTSRYDRQCHTPLTVWATQVSQGHHYPEFAECRCYFHQCHLGWMTQGKRWLHSGHWTMQV